jgi:hypothetical protein
VTNQLLDVLEAMDVLVRAVSKLAEGVVRESGSCESQSALALVERSRHMVEQLRAVAITDGGDTAA